MTESKPEARAKSRAKGDGKGKRKIKAKTKARAKAKPKACPKSEEIFQVGGVEVPVGTRQKIELPAGRLPTGDSLPLPVVAVNGAKPGPTIWLNAALHGDEINGMEIIHRVLGRLDPKRLSGQVLAVPIVNVFGFIQQSRYLPDRRDLNRHFPGSKRGSLASRLANLFLTEIVEPSDFGIDLHTGSLHRTNLPQIRADLSDPTTRAMAEAFGAPMIYSAGKIRGSLRAAATKRGVPILTYEAGEPLRFDEKAIELGVRGVLRVLRALGMRKLQAGERTKPKPPFEAGKTRWTRATRGGVLHLAVKLGQKIEKRTVLGTISDPSGEDAVVVKSRYAGLVIGYTNNPLIHKGDAMVHVAEEKGG